jgi:hypothetical protein
MMDTCAPHRDFYTRSNPDGSHNATGPLVCQSCLLSIKKAGNVMPKPKEKFYSRSDEKHIAAFLRMVSCKENPTAKNIGMLRLCSAASALLHACRAVADDLLPQAEQREHCIQALRLAVGPHTKYGYFWLKRRDKKKAGT